MKRLLVILFSAVCVASAMAQSFTIRRPADGSVVRETIKVRIPKASIGPSNYVGILVNGKYLEAVSPVSSTVEGNDFVYSLDTKGRNIPDGPLKIEAVLYGVFQGDGGEVHSAVNRSSVRVTLDNRSSLKAPKGGYRLRYNFQSGKQYTYKLEYKQSVSIMSEAQAKLGGRAPELPGDYFSSRYLYSFDNTYPGESGRREGLVRMQLLPIPGKDYAILPLSGDPTPKKRYQEQFVSVYMRVSDTGREIFGRAPVFFGLEVSSGEPVRQLIYGIFPLPILPTRGVGQGDIWGGAIAQGQPLSNFANIYTAEKISQMIPARGSVESIEWERGMRCVKVRNVIQTSSASSPGSEQEAEELYWFSLDLGMVVKLERTTTNTLRIQADQLAGGDGSGGGDPSGSPGRGGGRRPGRPGRGGAEDGGLTRPEDTPAGLYRQDGGEQGARGGRGGVGNRDGGGGGNNGGGNRGGRGTRILKSKVKFILTLE